MRTTLRTLAASLLALAATAAPAGFVDPLDLPSEPSPLAARGPLLALARAGDRLVAAGMRGHVLWSDDGGRSWSQATVPASVTLTALHFPAPRLGWAVGHGGLVLHSTDGGQSWQRQLDGRQTAQDMVAWYVERGATDPEAARLAAELPINWQDGPEQPWLGVWFADERHGYVTGAFGLMLETADGGEHWTPAVHLVENPDALHLMAIARIGNALYIPSERGTVFRRRDGEARFSPLQTPYAGSFFGVCGDERLLLAHGLRGALYASNDGGDNWQALPAVAPAALTACTPDGAGGFVLATGAGDLVRVDPPHGDPVPRLTPGAGWPLAALSTTADGATVAAGLQGSWRTEAAP